MTVPAVAFHDVSKAYPLYHHVTAGVKSFLFNLPEALRTLRTKRFTALDGLSFRIERGESFGIIGRNGAGKSTTLGLIAGVLRPSAGRVEVNGRPSPLLELGGGFHSDLTGRENIVLNGVLLGMLRSEVRAHMEGIIAFAELADVIDQPIRTYSSGMLARLGFAVVAHLDPEILLIDEVLAVGDILFQRKCMEKLDEFRRAGVTMVLVSHSRENVERMCDRALWLEGHTVREMGSPRKVWDAYAAHAG